MQFEHIKPCGRCGGNGHVMGAVMRIYCHECEGVGFFGVGDCSNNPACAIHLAGEVRRLVALVEMLSASTETVRHVRAENNSGPGGSCFTGD